MYSNLTPESAQRVDSKFLVAACNECRPESGAYLVAKNELAFRASKRALFQKLLFTVAGFLLGLLAGALKQSMFG